MNYRTDPDITARLLPAPLRPQIVNGWAVSGICLIRLSVLNGLVTENAAHRIAVAWDTPDGVAQGVYIPRRDTESRLVAWAGGRIFPGHHRHSRFDVQDEAGELHLAFADVDVHVRPAATLAGSHLFTETAQASEFFRRGAVAYSATPDPTRLDGLHLLTDGGDVTPVELSSVRSAYFDDPSRFPPATAIPDSAFLMRDLPAVWKPLPPMTVRPATEQPAPA
ncbi:DUF2071 domain-containing protein [Actinoplanes couchii]|uniref:Uncharacterized protein n=1 Tax=Actinoplanes couchii TaxID=403638 RepID=A0ABQ3XRJ3_9ACTN|nr:hypothetical protein Aco03nite_095350 [Actinoplanes couchii]